MARRVRRRSNTDNKKTIYRGVSITTGHDRSWKGEDRRWGYSFLIKDRTHSEGAFITRTNALYYAKRHVDEILQWPWGSRSRALAYENPTRKPLRIGSKAVVVAERTGLWKGTVGVVVADDSAGVTLRVGNATVTVPRSAVISMRQARGLGLHEASENPEPSTWMALGLAAVVITGAIYLLTRPTLATTIDPGSTYSITGALPSGGGSLSSIVASMSGAGALGPQWQNVKGVDNQNGTYTITATYAGTSSIPVPTGATVYKLG